MHQVKTPDVVGDNGSNLKAQQFFFKETVPDAQSLMSFGLPFFESAFCQPLKLEDLISIDPPDAEKAPKTIFRVVSLENGDSRIADMEQWVRSESKTVELNLRHARVIWSSRKCVIVSNTQSHASAVAGVTYFTFFESKLAALLQCVTDYSRTAQKDAALTHQVVKADLVYGPHVNEMTRWSWSARMQHAGIETGLHLLSDFLDPDAKRLVGELANSVNMTDRLEVLNDHLEIMEDLYELANDRLSEFTFYSNEYRLEVWIIVLLVLESAIMLFEAFAVMNHG